MDRLVCLSAEELAGLASGAPASPEVRVHLDSCPSCRRQLARGPAETETSPYTPPSDATADWTSGPSTDGPDRPGAGWPERIGKYHVVAPLGSGGQGLVYRAVHPGLGKELVIKLAREPLAAGAADRAGLVAEGRLLAGLDHPDLVRVYDLDFFQGRPFLVMEYVPGRSLRQYAGQKRPTHAESAALVGRVARAADAAHRRGVVHQDIKPANILIDADGHPRLIDFGLARLRHAWGDDPEGSGGTPAYMAPEQARGEDERVGPRSDVFALGAVLYDLLVGRPPFASSSGRKALDRAARCEFDREALRAARVPARLERVCLRAMAADPEDRYPSAADLAADLERFAAGPRRLAPFVVPAALLVAGLAGLGWWLAPDRGQRPSPPLPSAATPTVRGVPPAPVPTTPARPLRVLSLSVDHFRFDPVKQRSERFGTIGGTPLDTRLGDEVRVEAVLSEPAFCFLVAFNPDGSRQLCYPPNAQGKADETVRPARADVIRYPKRETSYFPLSDGRGQQVLVLFAFRAQPPPFAEWAPRLKDAPWAAARQGGIWAFDGDDVRPLYAHRGQETDRRPETFEALCRFLKGHAGADALAAVAFPVE
jgi:predicted Ser/Thr protein kinase